LLKLQDLRLTTRSHVVLREPSHVGRSRWCSGTVFTGVRGLRGTLEWWWCWSAWIFNWIHRRYHYFSRI